MGFEVRLRVDGDDGTVIHSELEYGGGLVMVSQEGRPADARVWKRAMKSPKSLGGNTTQSIMFFVDDADAHGAHARSCVVIVEEPATHDYGADYWTDRSYGALDPEGHMSWVIQRLSTGKA
ncbi:MAG: aminotransferase [Acidobacteriota bacterium]|nr:aminotransferase [Acidobacteriota bacterium]